MIRIGALVEIRPAYSAETGDQSIWDEIAGSAGRIVAVRGDDTVDLELLNGDLVDALHVRRLKFASILR